MVAPFKNILLLQYGHLGGLKFDNVQIAGLGIAYGYEFWAFRVVKGFTTILIVVKINYKPE